MNDRFHSLRDTYNQAPSVHIEASVRIRASLADIFRKPCVLVRMAYDPHTCSSHSYLDTSEDTCYQRPCNLDHIKCRQTREQQLQVEQE